MKSFIGATVIVSAIAAVLATPALALDAVGEAQVSGQVSSSADGSVLFRLRPPAGLLSDSGESCFQVLDEQDGQEVPVFNGSFVNSVPVFSSVAGCYYNLYITPTTGWATVVEGPLEDGQVINVYADGSNPSNNDQADSSLNTVEEGNSASFVSYLVFLLPFLALGLLIWLSILVANAAVKKGRNFWPWFWISLFFLIPAAIIVAIMQPKQELVAPVIIQASTTPDPPSGDTKTCPYCGEVILAVAVKCKHCGEFLDS